MKSLSVVIPVYNERKRLPKTIAEVEGYLLENCADSEVIISEAGSTDGTVDFIKNLKLRVAVKLVIAPEREGKGMGVKKGILKARKDWILFMDADNSTSIYELEKFVPLSKNRDVIIGSRYAGIKAKVHPVRDSLLHRRQGRKVFSNGVKQNIIRSLVSRLGAFAVRVITGLRFRDTQCGFKLFTKEAAHKIFSNLQTAGWGFDVEVLLRAKKMGMKIAEVPVEWRDSAGSHLRAGRDSLAVLKEVIKITRALRN